MIQLEKICGTSIIERTNIYNKILKAKTDISKLSLNDLLIKDLKVVNGIPIPGFQILVKVRKVLFTEKKKK
jgi:inorganic pyrophosphatase/exopolyphosphatase